MKSKIKELLLTFCFLFTCQTLFDIYVWHDSGTLTQKEILGNVLFAIITATGMLFVPKVPKDATWQEWVFGVDKKRVKN